MKAGRQSRWLRNLVGGWMTRGGLLYSMAVIVVGVTAVVSANNLLFLVLAMMMSVLLVSGLVSRLCLAGLELDFAMPENICAGIPVAGTLAVRNVKRWMPSFSIRVAGIAEETVERPILESAVYFPVIPGGATLEETIELCFPRRGAYRQNTFRFSTRFPFGFREKTAEVNLVREIVVCPSIDPQPGFEHLLAALSGELEALARGRGSDFYCLRPYQALESARFVDWKASAHAGELQVREFAREPDRSVEIFLDRHIQPGQEDWFEHAINCCAYLVWQITEQDAVVHFRTQRYERRIPEDGDAWTVLKYLALIEPLAAPAEAPHDPSALQIVLSAAPDRLATQGWSPNRIVTPALISSD